MKLPSIQEQIEKKVSLSELIEVYLKIFRKGNNYAAICPFHDDQKPSLIISNSKKIWKCFVCDVGGNSIKFVMLFLNLNFYQASQEIAEKFALNLPENWKKTAQLDPELEKLAEINHQAKIFFQMNLIKSLETTSSPVQNFCKNRHIDEKIVEKFELGWIAENDEKLWKFCLAKGFSKQELMTSGLFYLKRNRNKETVVNYFQKQLIFPIYDKNNLLAGFSGRQIDKQESKQNYSSKYINSMENLLFKKKTILYNWNVVKKKFPIAQTVYLVEGIMDAIRLTVHNYPALALMGTNLSQEQINLIKEHFQKLIIFPDPDKPGMASALKNSLYLIEAGRKVKIVTTTLPLDPDLALQEKNFDLNKVSAQTPVDFLFNQYKKQKNQTSEDLIDLIQKISKFLPFLEPIKKSEIKQNLAKISSFSQEEIEQQFDQIQTTKFIFRAEQKIPLTHSKQKQEEKWKEYLFQSLLLNLELLGRITKISGSFNHSEYDYYYQFLIKWYNDKTDKKNLSWETFLVFLKKKPKIKIWFRKVYSSTKKDANLNNLNEKIWQELLKKFIITGLKEEIRNLQQQIKRKNLSKEKKEQIWKKIIDILDKLKNENKN